jgi:flagellar basal body rod protein FlgG
LGTGVRPASNRKFFTGKIAVLQIYNFDTAIMGSGFFKIRLEDGSEAYTRNGKF